MTKKKHHVYNISQIEKNASDAYRRLKKKDTPSSRTKFFETIYNLALTILKVSSEDHKGSKNNHDSILSRVEDKEFVAHEYSTALFERVITGNFVFEIEDHKKIPWTPYIRLSIRDTIFKKLNEIEVNNVIDGVMQVVNFEDEYLGNKYVSAHTVEDARARKFLPHELLRRLKVFYSYDEIKRLLSISLELLGSKHYAKKVRAFTKEVPVDVRDFSIVLVSLAKRLIVSEGYNVDDKNIGGLKNALSSAVKSTVFLATVANTKLFPIELFLSLDIDCLYRLVTVAGGTTIRIPTTRELDSLIAGVLSAGQVILDGKDIDSALKTVKKNYSLVMANTVNIHKFIENILVLAKDENVGGKPLINMVLSSMKSLSTVFSEVVNKSGELNGEAILHHYTELNKLLTNVTSSLLEINER
jgi:hypothetical protein